MITRLFPLSTDVSGSDWTPFGASPAHVGLSDGSDATGVQRQMSVTEPFRIVKGTAMTQLPATGGQIKQLTIGFRGQVDIAASSSLTVTLGGGLRTLSVPDLATVATTYTGVSGPLTFAQINALTWDITAAWFAHNGVLVTGYELYLDVEWYPINAFQVSVP
jgi:hypothetical protein